MKQKLHQKIDLKSINNNWIIDLIYTIDLNYTRNYMKSKKINLIDQKYHEIEDY